MTASDELHSLPIYRQAFPERWAIEAELDCLLGDTLSHELIWATRPVLSHLFSAPADALSRTRLVQRLSKATEYGSSPSRVFTSYALQRFNFSRPHILYASMEDRVLKVWSTENHRISLLGGHAARRVRKIAVPARTNRSLAKDAKNAVYDVAVRTSLPAGELLRVASQAASIQERLRRLIDETQPKAVVTASTQHAFCRLSVSISRSRGVPSIYVPHAPTALHRHYADIPHDYAALRGEADFQYYARLGANTEQVSVVGDQSIDPPIHRPLHGPPTILIATTKEKPLDKLITALEALHDSGLRKFTTILVAPHPRGRARVASVARRFNIDVIPRGTRTSQALARMNILLAVVEESSGVSLECMAYGVPVFLLSPQKSTYLFEKELPIERLEISRFTEVLQRSLRHNPRAFRTEVNVSSFIAATGETASKSLRAVLSGPIVAAPAGVLDSWRLQRQ